MITHDAMLSEIRRRITEAGFPVRWSLTNQLSSVYAYDEEDILICGMPGAGLKSFERSLNSLQQDFGLMFNCQTYSFGSCRTLHLLRESLRENSSYSLRIICLVPSYEDWRRRALLKSTSSALSSYRELIRYSLTYREFVDECISGIVDVIEVYSDALLSNKGIHIRFELCPSCDDIYDKKISWLILN